VRAFDICIKVPVCRSRGVCTQGRKGVAELSGSLRTASDCRYSSQRAAIEPDIGWPLSAVAVAALVVLINACESEGVGLGAGGSGIGGGISAARRVRRAPGLAADACRVTHRRDRDIRDQLTRLNLIAF
jgi:hypothetical protein